VSDETNAHNTADHIELWKNWNETTSAAWSSNPGSDKQTYKDFFNLYISWMKPGTYFKLWYNVGGMWARMIEDMLNGGRLLEANSHFIEAYLSVVRVSHLVNEVAFQGLQLPTRAEIARVAQHVAALEERVYMIEDAFVNLEDGRLKATPDQVPEGLVEHQKRLRDRSEIVDTLSSILEQTSVIEDLAGHLRRVEDKLNVLLSSLERIEAEKSAESAFSDNGCEVHDKEQKEA
jgi:hypothetical protein